MNNFDSKELSGIENRFSKEEIDNALNKIKEIHLKGKEIITKELYESYPEKEHEDNKNHEELQKLGSEEPIVSQWWYKDLKTGETAYNIEYLRSDVSHQENKDEVFLLKK